MVRFPPPPPLVALILVPIVVIVVLSLDRDASFVQSCNATKKGVWPFGGTAADALVVDRLSVFSYAHRANSYQHACTRTHSHALTLTLTHLLTHTLTCMHTRTSHTHMHTLTLTFMLTLMLTYGRQLVKGDPIQCRQSERPSLLQDSLSPGSRCVGPGR